jgi:hypothetical protein
MAKVLRILSVAALLVAVVAGCGDAAPQRSAADGVPRALAREWEKQASAIATAAAAGNDCRAMHLAASLRTEVAVARHKLPLRLRSPLLTGVNALADRLSTCTPAVPASVQPKPPKGPKPEPPKHHGPHGHDKGDGKGHDK